MEKMPTDKYTIRLFHIPVPLQQTLAIMLHDATKVLSCPKCGHHRLDGLLAGLSEPLHQPSDMYHFPRTNDEPSSYLQEQMIRTYIAHEETRFSSLNETIAQLRAALHALERMRDLSRSALLRYKSAINPIRRLPTEILLQIFRYATAGDDEPSISRIGANTAWILSRVCTRWRYVAIYFKNVVATKDATVTVIPEQGSLSVFVDSLRRPPERHPMAYYFQDVLTHIATYSGSWNSLTLHIFPFFLQHLNILRDRLGSLKALEVRSTPEFCAGESSLVSAITTFLHMPQFHTLTASACFALLLPLPLQQVRHLRVLEDRPSSSLTDVWNLLHRAPFVETLSLAYFAFGQPLPCRPLQDLSLDRLTSLSISTFAYSALDALTLPSLVHCKLHSAHTFDGFQPPYSRTEMLKRFFWRSSRASGGLKHLQVWDYSSEEIDLLELLRGSLTLVDVEIRSSKRSAFPGAPTSCSRLVDVICSGPASDFLPEL